MKNALIQIRPDEDTALEESFERAELAMRTGIPSDPVATFTFSSESQLFDVFTAKRFELISKLQKSGPSSIRGLARALGRDVRRVHDDVAALIDWGMIERNADGMVFVPFDVIHIDFALKAAA